MDSHMPNADTRNLTRATVVKSEGHNLRYPGFVFFFSLSSHAPCTFEVLRHCKRDKVKRHQSNYGSHFVCRNRSLSHCRKSRRYAKDCRIFFTCGIFGKHAEYHLVIGERRGKLRGF